MIKITSRSRKVVDFESLYRSNPTADSKYVYWNGRFMETKVYLRIRLKEILSRL